MRSQPLTQLPAGRSVEVMRILLTGAAGFIGSTIADQLLSRGDEVVGLDALLPAAHGSGGTRWAPPDMEVGDIRDRATLRRLLSGADAVCHQAAMVGLGVDVQDLPEYVGHNVLGTSVLLAEMARAGVPVLVQASSMVVYGEGGYSCEIDGPVRPGQRSAADLEAGRFEPACQRCGRPLTWDAVDEKAVLDPRNAYATTKVAQEQLASGWARQTGGSVTSLRYHNVYGPRMPRDTPYAGVAAIFRSALEAGHAPRVFEDGGQMRDFIHVADVAAANLAALDRITGERPPEVSAYNIASGNPHTVGEFATELAAAFGGPAPVVVGGGRPGDVRHVVADPALARTELGFSARIDFAEGVRAFATDPLRSSATRAYLAAG